MKRKFFIPFIYLPVLLSVIWARFSHFSNISAFLSYLAVTSFLMYVLRGRFVIRNRYLEETEKERQISKQNIPYNQWSAFSDELEKNLREVDNTPLAVILMTIIKNSRDIAKAVEDNSECTNNHYLRQYLTCYSEIFKVYIEKYVRWVHISDPPESVRSGMKKIEEEFARYAHYSNLLLNEVYRTDLLTIGGGKGILEHYFSSLEKSDFHTEVERAQEENKRNDEAVLSAEIGTDQISLIF